MPGPRAVQIPATLPLFLLTQIIRGEAAEGTLPPLQEYLSAAQERSASSLGGWAAAGGRPLANSPLFGGRGLQ